MKALASEIVEYVLKCVFCPESACNLLTPGDPESKSSDGTLSIFCRFLGDRLGNGFLDGLMMRKTVTKFILRHLYSRYKAFELRLTMRQVLHHVDILLIHSTLITSCRQKTLVNSLFYFVSKKPSSDFQTKPASQLHKMYNYSAQHQFLLNIYKAQIIQIK